jgi:hypothetical protein
MNGPGIRHVAAVLLMVAGGTSSARAADDAPFVTPQQDVDVTYSIAAPDPSVPTVRQRMRWSERTRRQRVDPEGSAVYMVTDYGARSLSVIDLAHRARTMLPAPGPALSAPGQRAEGSWSRGATMLVAGQSCTVWRTPDMDGHASDVCYSDDGVMMQVVQGGRLMVRAESVARAAQPDSVFAIPPGLKDIAAAHP